MAQGSDARGTRGPDIGRKRNAGDKDLLNLSLQQSSVAIVKLLEFAVANGGRFKGFKPHVFAFGDYLIAHEAHHRSQIILALKQSDHPLDKKILYGIWEWETQLPMPSGRTRDAITFLLAAPAFAVKYGVTRDTVASVTVAWIKDARNFAGTD